MIWDDKRCVFLVGLVFVLGGCGENHSTPLDASVSSDAGTVTYFGDVRPVLAEHCVGCHSVGGIGPFALDTYESAARLATRIKETTRDRIMPPWPADNSGECNTFSGARWLDDAELAILAAWDEQGEPMGDPSTPAPTVPSLPTLTGSTSTIETPVYAPSTSASDDYRCFVVDAVQATDTYLTGFQVRPGNSTMVHHVIVYAPVNGSAANAARSQDTGTGYPCFGGAGVNAYPVALWAPGSGATHYPENTGIRLIGGMPLIIQVHYNLLAAGDGTDQTRVDLETAARATNAGIVSVADLGLMLPPRVESVSTTHTENLSVLTGGADISLTIYGMFPHMHTLGRELRVEHLPHDSTESQCLIDVPRWNFNWQLSYFFETPITISSLDSLRITCTYDTRDRTLPVTWGEGTQDEMCINFLYVVAGGGL